MRNNFKTIQISQKRFSIETESKSETNKLIAKYSSSLKQNKIHLKFNKTIIWINRIITTEKLLFIDKKRKNIRLF